MNHLDLSNPKTIRDIAAKFGFTFKKGFGQNFLTSGAVLDEIVSAAGCSGGGVLEIGPGFGVLTRELSKSARKVVSLEIDERLIDVLSYTLAGCGNVKIINRDVLKTDLARLIGEEFPDEKISVAANLPYYITTPIITKLLEERLPLKCIVVMVQKEVAQRLCAEPSTKNYGAITLLARYFSEPEIVTGVPAGLFVPQPKVDSAVLKLTLLPEPRVKVSDESMFFKAVSAAFSQRRKTLLNCFSSYFSADKAELAEALEKINIDPRRRGETLSIEEFAAAADMLSGMMR